MNDSIEAQHQEPPEIQEVLRAELLISTLLRVGVIASLSLVVFGTALSFVHHREYLSSPPALQRLTHPGAAFPHTLKDVFEGALELRGQSVVMVGLLLLIATPVLRVAVSVLIFLHQRDYVFAAITLLVLGLLLFSFVVGKVEG